MRVKGNHKIILTVLLSVGAVAANAQQASILQPKKYLLADSAKLPEMGKKNLNIPTGVGQFNANQFYYIPPITGGSVIRPDYYTRQWGIFCEGEWRFEKMTLIPLRVRLGSLDYVNRLEGKH